MANTDTILAISALLRYSPNLASLISLIVVISFSHAYKYASISSADKLVPEIEHLSLTCHPNSISSSSSGCPPPDDPHPPPHHGFFSHASLFAFRWYPLGHDRAQAAGSDQV
ncbi:hypothetical protein J6V86_01140 [bacterium]|nr:hypothetical protein [bacterium]